jgi:TRAP-type C4-dicarboxylate transport system substrate-binding protein
VLSKEEVILHLKVLPDFSSCVCKKNLIINKKNKEKKMKKFYLILALIVAVGFGFMPHFNWALAQDSAKPIVWKISSAFSPGSFLYKDLLPRFSEEVDKRSGGRLKIKMYPPGALVKVRELYNAVQKGVVEGGMSAGLYHARLIPEALIETGLPQSFADYRDASEYYYDYKNGRALSLIREAYKEKGTYFLGVYPLASYVLMTKFPVNTLQDLEGKKLRTFGPYSLLAKSLKAATVSIPGAEQYMALQRGTVEGTIYPFYALEMYKLKEVIDYVTLPPIAGSIMIDLYLNLDAWQALPDDIKKICNEVARELVPWVCGETEKLDKEYLVAAKKKGIQFITLPEEEAAKLKAVAVNSWDVFGKKTPRCKELISMLKEYLKQKGTLK